MFLQPTSLQAKCTIIYLVLSVDGSTAVQPKLIAKAHVAYSQRLFSNDGKGTEIPPRH